MTKMLTVALALLVPTVAMAQIEVKVNSQTHERNWTQACKLSTACNSAQMTFCSQIVKQSKGPEQASTAMMQQGTIGWDQCSQFFQNEQAANQDNFYKACQSYYKTLSEFTPKTAVQARSEGRREPEKANIAESDLPQIIQVNGLVCQALEGYKLHQNPTTRQEAQKIVQSCHDQNEKLAMGNGRYAVLAKAANELIDSMQIATEK